MKKVIVVLGMHRSGTSAITRGLELLGADLGTELMPAAEGDNEKGFFEDLGIYAINERILEKLGSSWHALGEISPSSLASKLLDDEKRDAIETLRQRTENCELFAFKDPRTANLLPFWQSVFEALELDDSYVVAVRNPKSVADSLAKRNGFAHEKSFILWMKHYCSALHHIDKKSYVVIDYDRLIEDPLAEISRISTGLNLTDPNTDSEALSLYLEEFLSPELRHNKHDSVNTKCDTVPAFVASMHEWLAEEARDGSPRPHSSVIRQSCQSYQTYRSIYSYIDRLDKELEQVRRETQAKLIALTEQNTSLKAEQHRLETALQSEQESREEQLQELKALKIEYEALNSAKTVLAREHQALVSDYAHFRHINRQKLDTLYSRLYLFDRSMLGKVLKVLEKLYFIVRLKPRSKSYLRHQISEAKQYISDNEVNPADFAESYSRLRLVLKVLRFSIQHPFSTLRIANKQRLKKLAKSILSDDSVQAYKWIDSRLPSPGKKPLPDTVTNDNSLESLELSFPVFSAMQVSIIVPVFNQYRTTVSCLKSVLDHTTSINYEVIVADDCSDDATQSIEDRVKNITVVRGEQNQGFLKNCNNAVTHASGEYVVLLNNDTNVQDGWLSALVDVMETRPDTGLVGPKLLFENGILQEAGGIIWQDASGWNYGRGQNPELPEFNYLRETDYISGACILFRKSIWDELGGFDERFYPAYYEDTDLAFQMREKGLKVMYQPASEVVHFEGVSNGSDLNSGIKKHQLLNQKVFKEKWAERLATDHFPNAENVFQARERSKGKRTIVVIDHYVPFYDQDAGSRSTYLYVKSMAEAGLNVKFLPANFYPHRPYTNTLEQLGIEVLYGETHARDWKKWFRENAQYIDVVYLHRPHITEDFVDELNTLNPRPRLIYFGHDLHYLRTQREAEVLGDSDLRVESEEWKKRELAIFGKVDKVYYPSQVEVDEVKRISPETNVMAIPLYLLDKPDPADYRHEERRGLLFVGGFGHAPNEDAVIWFTSKVMPQLVEADPSICLHIVGSRVPESVQSLASDNILVHGFVSDEDLQTLYREARLCIVPLRYGAGVKGKVLEALQAGIPIVTTTIGAEGLPEAETVMAIANKAPKMIEETLSLYNSPEQCSKYLTRYPDYIERNFSQKEVQRVIERDFLN